MKNRGCGGGVSDWRSMVVVEIVVAVTLLEKKMKMMVIRLWIG